MPNWCTTSYVITGDKKTLRLFNRKLSQLRNRKGSLRPNGFGKLWCGNVAYLLGEKDPAHFSCRGEINEFTLSPDGLRLDVSVMSAWVELSELRKLVQEKYPDVSIFFISEEPGCCVYETNDHAGEVFPEKFILEWFEDSKSGEFLTGYFKSLDEASEFIFETILDGKPIGKTRKEIIATLDAYQESHPGVSYIFEEFSIVD